MPARKKTLRNLKNLKRQLSLSRHIEYRTTSTPGRIRITVGFVAAVHTYYLRDKRLSVDELDQVVREVIHHPHDTVCTYDGGSLPEGWEILHNPNRTHNNERRPALKSADA